LLWHVQVHGLRVVRGRGRTGWRAEDISQELCCCCRGAERKMGCRGMELAGRCRRRCRRRREVQGRAMERCSEGGVDSRSVLGVEVLPAGTLQECDVTTL
jgi:hypothetical protein